MKKLPKIILCFYLCLFTNTVWAQSLNEDAFNLLDLNYPGLEEVNRLYNEALQLWERHQLAILAGER